MNATPWYSRTHAALPPLSRRGFLWLGAGAATAYLAGCGGGEGVGGGAEGEGVGGFSGEAYSGPDVTLDYWNGFTGGDGPAMRALVKKFDAEHDNIAIKNNSISWPDFYQQLPAATQAGKGPDVGVMHLDQIATNAARGVIVPLDDLAEALDLTEDNFAPSVWGPGIYEDQRYSIPFDVHTIAMYYNKEHFKEAGISEPPTDAASLDEALQKLQQAGFDQPFWMPNLWPAHLMFLSLLWQFGGEPYGGDGTEATFGSEAGVQALTWMVEQIDKGYSPTNVEADAQYTAFKNGDTSITWDGIWQINDLQDSGVPFGIAPIPTIGDEPAAWANSHNFFLPSGAADDENVANAAKTLIGWMSEQSADWSDAGMIPALNAAREQAAFMESPQYALKEQIGHLHFLSPVPGLGEVTPETIEVAVNEAVLGTKSVEDALADAQEDAAKLVEDVLEQYQG
ncbi:MAG: ABC transporter substrate-binding protein [Nocardioidaceae bacterium]